MYNIEKRPSGYILTFTGVIDEEEMQRWVNDSKEILLGETSSSFGVVVDMKELQPLTDKARAIMVGGQDLFKKMGMNRSAVILNSEEVCNQFKKIAIESGIYTTERYFNAAIETNTIEKAISWVKDGIDPDK